MILFAHLTIRGTEHKPEQTYQRKDGQQGTIPEHWIVDADVQIRRYSRLRKEWKVVIETVELHSSVEPPVKQGKATAAIETRLGGFNRDQIEYRISGYEGLSAKPAKEVRGE